MFRKFEKTPRIRVPQWTVPGKFYLSDKEIQALLTGTIDIEEKLDGANVGIGRKKQVPGFFLQKRGSLVGPSEHAQFNYFVNWANSQIPVLLTIPMGWIVYFELLYAQHHIFYDSLPAYMICTEVWDGATYISRQKKEDFCNERGFACVPLIYHGPAVPRSELISYIPNPGSYTQTPAEGLVVKNYRKQIRGKVVRPGFMKELDESDHWAETAYHKNLLAKQPATALSDHDIIQTC